MDLKAYLEENDISKQIKKLAKKCRGRKVVFYGAGEFFYLIKDNNDLSDFDVVGIADLKFCTNPEENKTEYKTMIPNDLKTESYDVIIITLYNDLQVLPHIEKIIKGTKNHNADLYPIMTPKISYLWKKLFEPVKIHSSNKL